MSGSVRSAATISVGDELLAGESLDTHGRTIARALGLRGIRVTGHRVVGDDVDEIADAITQAGKTADLIVVTGGLGPTLDDVTREALAAATGDPLVRDEEAIRSIEAWFAGRDRPMPATNERQALRPGTAEILRNDHGTAPGILQRWGDRTVVVLPGPPRELLPMLADVLQRLLPEEPPRPVRVVRAHGIGESDAASRIEALMSRDRSMPVATTVSDSIVNARIRGRTAGDEAAVEALADEVAAAWGGHVFGRDEETLEAALGRELLARGLSIATAESCTGGGVGAAITAVAGSSAWYPGGVVTYADERKVEELDVDAGVIQRCGAVSGEVVSALARGVRRRCRASLGVATSGVAGPGGGSEEKPVGTVWISVVDDHGEDTRCFRFPGDRAIVRRRTVLAALQMARLRVIGERLPLLWERSVGATGRSS